MCYILTPGTEEYDKRTLTDGYGSNLVDLDKVEFEDDLVECLKLLVLIAQAYYYTSENTLFTDKAYDFLAERLEILTGLSWGQGGSPWNPYGRTRRLIHLALQAVNAYLSHEELELVNIEFGKFRSWAIYDRALHTYARYAYEAVPTRHTLMSVMHKGCTCRMVYHKRRHLGQVT